MRIFGEDLSQKKGNNNNIKNANKKVENGHDAKAKSAQEDDVNAEENAGDVPTEAADDDVQVDKHEEDVTETA